LSKINVVDYTRSVEELIPGVQGLVLGVLSRTEMEMTIRTVANLAGASPQQTSVIVAHLVDLGIVARREAGSSALVRLERENEAARLLLALARLSESALVHLAEVARDIKPSPASLTVFGSFARGEAVASSDLDVLAVRPEGVAAGDNVWIDSLGQWEVAARKIVGNPVNLLVVSSDELPARLRRRAGPWHAIVQEGILLIGAPISTLTSVA
jgi:predicted nucleotidyltransferase